MKKRIEWIDWVKSFAIYLVVLVHIHCDYYVDCAIKSFVIPLFFILSGFLFNIENNPSPKDFVIKRFRQLIIPYLWINILAYLAWVFVLRNYGSNVGDELEWHTPLRAIFIGVAPLLVHDIPLWSLLSFFIVEIVFYFSSYLKFKWWMIFGGSFVLFYFLYWLYPDTLYDCPLVAGASLLGLIYYSIGNGCRKVSFVSFNKGWISLFLNFIVIILLCCIFIPIVYFNGYPSFYTCQIGNFLLYFIGSLCGAGIFILFFKIISSLFKEPKIINVISVGTLLVVGFHLLVFAFIKGVMLFVFGIEPETYIYGVLNGSLLAIVILALCIPIIWFIRKYARFLICK